jgi:hypothetical protein
MEDSDPLSRFFAEACDVRASAKCPPAVLFAAYQKWHARAIDVDDQPVTAPIFGHLVGGQFLKQGKPATWRGIAPRGSVVTEEDDDDD